MLFTLFGIDGMITNRCDAYLDFIGRGVSEEPAGVERDIMKKKARLRGGGPPAAGHKLGAFISAMVMRYMSGEGS
ncbi:MAG TPA: hypothetical protein PLM53_03900 [Spirochaetota bacterium]|nr:hypothetical protein [Spirochaetota bacterium]HPC40206.1 hypothetical protein [Spirochaetota bacterium]HPL16186.1 hypothetical protein [Spirochaetota bacterium]HQF07320.1 hypothetical protein [Spirochaetota bacterium]HQH96221.1 hypothetical protein [Spirochaetota bacterium]